ncbi:MAG: glycerophosphodiester phosphodiesterase, partial [Bacteroidetes bacterium]|nr:glycerophosphodiester phosphodiesterase [Bacteroidota bacterium]
MMNLKSDKKSPLIIAHRGESADAPENTLAAINLAWQRDDDAVEIDIHLTLDNHIVVNHDYTTKRTGNANLTIRKSTTAELRKIDVGSFKNSKWRNERIPLLSEVLATLPGGKKLFIEIKSSKKIISFLREELIKFKINPEQVQIIGFNRSTLKEVKKKMPGFTVLWLINLDYNWFTKLTSVNTKRLLLKASKSGLDGVDAFAGEMITTTFVQEAKAMNLLVYTWTIDNLEQAQQLVQN